VTGASGLARDVVALACAASAGIHAALAPAHFAEGRAAGVAFVASAGLLAVVAVEIRRPSDRVVPLAAVLVLGGLLASYVAATTSGVPLVHPDPEPVDGLALATKAIEAVGLLAALRVGAPATRFHTLRTKGRLT
jgi:hypothetical protein